MLTLTPRMHPTSWGKPKQLVRGIRDCLFCFLLRFGTGELLEAFCYFMLCCVLLWDVGCYISRRPWGKFLKFGTNVLLNSKLNRLNFGCQRSNCDITKHIFGHFSIRYIIILISDKLHFHKCLIRWNDEVMTFYIQKIEGQLNCDMTCFLKP